MINKDKIKGFIAGISIATILCSTSVFAEKISKTITAVYNSIKIVVDGNEITPKDAEGKVVEPFIIDGTTYLPVRAIASALNKDVNWDGNTNTVYIGEMPAKRSEFMVDVASLEKFTGMPLYTVGNQQINGGIFNLLIAENAIDYYMQMYADNYAPDKTLQTLTINNQPAAKYLCDMYVKEIISIFSIYDQAQRSGFLNDSAVKKQIENEWNSFRSTFATESQYNTYISNMAISDSDIKKLVEALTVVSLYGDSIYNNNLTKAYNTSSYEAEYRKNYITAKHILVEDEALAKEIITRLKKGESFDVLMETYNIDPGATKDGYTFTYGEMVAPFEKASYALKINTYTQEPVKTNYGYHIIYRCALSDAAVSEAIELYKRELADAETVKEISEITSNISATAHANYETYITTIK